MKPEPWNRCDVCGRFIALSDFHRKRATRQLVTPDSDYSAEEYETLCKTHSSAHRFHRHMFGLNK